MRGQDLNSPLVVLLEKKTKIRLAGGVESLVVGAGGLRC